MGDKPYWFPAKRYGWGWGLPKTWQGWVGYSVYFALLVAGCLVFPPAQNEIGFIATLSHFRQCCVRSVMRRESHRNGGGGGDERVASFHGIPVFLSRDEVTKRADLVVLVRE